MKQKMPTFLQMNVYTLFKKYPPSNASDSYMLAKFDAIVIRRKHRQQHNHPLSLGNCDIDFFNFRHCKVENFKILNLYFFETEILEASFETSQKLNRKSTKYFKTSQSEIEIL